MTVYRYLTASYVAWLPDTPTIPIAKRRNQAVIGYPRFDGTEHWLPLPDQTNVVQGIEHDGELYEREADGLAYVRLTDHRRRDTIGSDGTHSRRRRRPSGPHAHGRAHRPRAA